MPDFANLPAYPFLREFSLYNGPYPYRHFAQFLNHHGYRVFPKHLPLGREVTEHDVRRFVHREFQQHPRWPVGRAATQDDFNAIMVQIITDTDEEGLQ